MSDVNQVVLIGRLVRDAELKYTTSGKAVTKFSIAVNEKRKAGDQWKDSAGFFEIVLWGQIAESLQPYLSKGKQIAVIGKLTQERWEKDGENRSKVTVTASTVQLLGGSSPGANSGSENKQETYTSSAADEGFADEIPF
jgi:single-strand DNA-binding protein